MGKSCRIYGKHESAYNILITKPKKKRLPETKGVDGSIIIIYIEIR